MNCPNCGAAMHLIESRRYFQCRHCGTFHFPETVEADGIRIVGHPADAVPCPVCRVPMAHALLDGHHPIDFCAKCRGVLLPRATFALVTQKRRAWATTPPIEPVPFERLELRREIACVRCGARFQTYPHLGPGSVVIDSCAACDVIWLDFGEMKLIVDAPGRDRGTRYVPPVGDAEVYTKSIAGEEAHASRRHADDPLGFLLDLFTD